MRKGTPTLGSLKYWAKLDNPSQYDKIMEGSILSKLDICIRSDGAHGDIADVIAKYMKDKIIYDTKVKSWYYVDEITNIWKADSEGSFIYRLCKTSICMLFSERSMYWTKAASQTQDVNLQDQLNERSKKSLKIALLLKNTSFVKYIIPQLKSVMSVDDFVENYLDHKIDILAFENCVYDMKECIFRKIEPTDYISITTGYNYDENVDPAIVEEVLDIIRSMFATDEVYGYILDIITSILFGKNMFQEFYIMTGTASNGKSMLMNSISQVMGGYAKRINASTFTKPSKSANETSELYNCKGVRFIYTEEPDAKDKLITSRLKEYSGDSKIKTRGLFAHPIEWMPQFKIMICCNDIPELSKIDGGISRRLRVVEFKYKFLDETDPIYDKKNPYHKLIDRSINEKFGDDMRYRQAFAKILCENWKNNVKHLTSMCSPKEVLEASKSFIEECNDVLKFIRDNYDITGDHTNDTIPARDLYMEYKGSGGKLDEKEFSYRLIDMGIKKAIKGKSKKSYRTGIKMKPDEKDE
jgi:P4 family phage/plasmid primase-like protien